MDYDLTVLIIYKRPYFSVLFDQPYFIHFCRFFPPSFTLVPLPLKFVQCLFSLGLTAVYFRLTSPTFTSRSFRFPVWPHFVSFAYISVLAFGFVLLSFGFVLLSFGFNRAFVSFSWRTLGCGGLLEPVEAQLLFVSHHNLENEQHL